MLIILQMTATNRATKKKVQVDAGKEEKENKNRLQIINHLHKSIELTSVKLVQVSC